MFSSSPVPDCTAGPPSVFFVEIWRPVSELFCEATVTGADAGGWCLEIRLIEDAKSGRAKAKKQGRRVSHSYFRATVESFVGSLGTLDGTSGVQNGKGAFFGVQPRSRQRRSGSKDEDVRTATAIALDFDSKDFGGSLEATYRAVTESPIRPSIIVQTGNGFHVYWLLDEAWWFESAESYAEVVRGFAEALGADLVAHNASRVLRIPGSWHLKDPSQPKLVRIIAWEPERRYPIDEFLPYRSPFPIPASASRGIEFEDLEASPDLASLGLSVRCRDLIESGEVPREWCYEDGKPDRSRRDFNVVLELLRTEVAPSAIRAVFAEWPVGEKFAEEGDRYLARTIARAQAVLDSDQNDEMRGGGSVSATAKATPIGGNGTLTAPPDAPGGTAPGEPQPMVACPVLSPRSAADVVSAQLQAPLVIWGTEDAPLLACGELSLLHAREGVGKSWFTLGLAAAVAGGKETFLGMPVQQARVLVISPELSPYYEQQRLRHVIGSDTPPDDLLVLGRDAAGLDLAQEAHLERLKAVISEHKPRLLFLDPLAALWLSDELNLEYAILTRKLGMVADSNDLAILLSHHEGKAATKAKKYDDSAFRGGTALRAGVRTAIRLAAEPQTHGVRVSFTKSNLGRLPDDLYLAPGKPWKFEVTDAPPDPKVKADAIDERIRNFLERAPRSTAGEIAAEVGIHVATVGRRFKDRNRVPWLRRAKAQGEKEYRYYLEEAGQ